MSDSGFLTDERARAANIALVVTAGTGACLSLIVLVLYGIVALDPHCRPFFNRVSFRLLVYAMIANMIYGLANAVCTVPNGPGGGCSFTAWLILVSLFMSSWLLFCIALNLQLVLVHESNGRRLEKYYVLVSLTMPFIQTIPPYAAGVYGFDRLSHICWYDDSGNNRLDWQLGTQFIWTILLVTGEVSCFLRLLFYLLRHEVRINEQLQVDIGAIKYNATVETDGSQAPSKPPTMVKRYRNIIIRIGLYPLCSCIFNISTVTIDIFQTKRGSVRTVNDYRVLILGYVFYGSRAIFYALLAATDPAFIRGIRLFIARRRRTHFGTRSSDEEASPPPLAVRIELQQVSQADNGDIINLRGARNHRYNDINTEGEGPMSPGAKTPVNPGISRYRKPTQRKPTLSTSTTEMIDANDQPEPPIEDSEQRERQDLDSLNREM